MKPTIKTLTKKLQQAIARFNQLVRYGCRVAAAKVACLICKLEGAIEKMTTITALPRIESELVPFIQKARERFISYLIDGDTDATEIERCKCIAQKIFDKFEGKFWVMKSDTVDAQNNYKRADFVAKGGKIIHYSYNNLKGDKAREEQAFLVYAQELESNLEYYQNLELETTTEIQETAKYSESDLEDAYHWADSAKFTGPEKQIKWARDIATKSLEYIVAQWKEGNELNLSAKWWIENRR